MGSKKFRIWKTIPSVCCFNIPKNQTNSLNTKANYQITTHRLSLSDVKPISLTDLSTSLVLLQVFTLLELKEITRNFSRSSCVGEGGFGPVYKGFIDSKSVAVKVLNFDGSQGHREWLAEVIFLGQLKHPHLVKLIGYCCEDEHRLLVYEFMERGNLYDHLFRGYRETLPWLTRIRIALGSAKGLAFLHEEDKPIIYRDFKASNILLDHDFNAKLSDFGLATDAPNGDETHVIMGTEGYAAPEYVKTGYLTTMSDVFSFGVVFLELLTGRKATDQSFRKKTLIEWAKPYLKDKNKLHLIMDPRFEGQYSADEARKATALTLRCLSNHSKSRPTMRTVVNTLESILSLTNDIPIGPFVYVVPNEGKDATGTQIGDNGRSQLDRRGSGSRHRIKAIRSQAVYSDTAFIEKTLK